MKTRKTAEKSASLAPDSQKRLIAYTTAAGLGAFFAGQHAEAQVVESSALSFYPQTLGVPNGTGASHDYFYLDIDGDGTADVNFVVNTWRVNISGTPLNPSSNSYLIPWSVGMTIDGSTGSAPTYKPWLATPNFNNFSASGALGFKFVGSTDGQTHFAYMDVQVNGSASGIGSGDYTATVSGIFYNQTPGAGITVVPVPEPSSLGLLALGIAGLAIRRFRAQPVG